MSTIVSRTANPLVETRRFYLLLSILIAILATIGFWPQYFGPVISGTGDALPIIHFHASVYVLWLLLFIAQCAFVAVGKVALHRQVGKLGLVWGIVVIAVGVTVTYVRFSDRLSEGGIALAQNFGLWPILDMVLFASFFGAAAIFRRKPELHKRLMIVAASSILIASVGRFTEFDPNSGMSHLITTSLWMSPILLAMAYDFCRHEVVHPAYVTGVIVLTISSFREPLRFTGAWEGFTHWLAATIA